MYGHDAGNLDGAAATVLGVALPGAAEADPCRRIFDTIGLRRRAGDEARLSGWLQPRLHALRLPSVAAYADLIAAGGEPGRHERERLMEHFSTGETYFFRDQGLFGLLAARILPELVARRSAQRTLRLWSAGCASGEEAYTLAMLIDEMAPELVGWDVRIAGTDINGDAIARARRGAYGQWSFRTLDEARKARYFRKSGREWQIDARLQVMVDFERRDLLQDDAGEAGGFDLILCRNVFIYLTAPAVTSIAEKLAAALSEGGYFVPGHGELLGCVPPGLEALAYPDATAYRRAAAPARPLPPRPPSVPSSAPTGLPRTLPGASLGGKRSSRQHKIEPRPKLEAAPAAGADEMLAQAWRAADRGAAQTARAACEQVLAVSPLDPRPYFLLAKLAEERRAIDEAQTLLRKVLYLDPGFVAAHLELADLCTRSGDVRRARQLRTQALRELEKMPSDVPLPVPPHATAGSLLRGLRAAAGDAPGGPEEAPDG
ncbi:hypothetical protein GPA22_14905 [Aromatoleum toluvorans]|uniref:CheR-type methyltransferase domain-containing protein n=1 Tax=Aromatoleum toluvorans TaxID=92002 RepID=A0ABX1Q2A8_9RHOO|nr:protein-glutamate O-methyltransferase CheR [Aromatoleum toluvorans]NMG45015.1 hypothetical protein [Aromatoleum toluvorans]